MTDETKYETLQRSIDNGFNRIHERIDTLDTKINNTNIKVAEIGTELRLRKSISPSNGNKLNAKMIVALTGAIIALSGVVSFLVSFIK